MTTNDLIADVEKLCGMTLKSIRPGSDIAILSVDSERGNLILRTKTDDKKSRPISELQLLWGELTKKPAIHVDEALHGSGTSRNQPETILANLPYIEWLTIDGKKHIAYVGKRTHPYGTLKQMSPSDAEQVRSDLRASEALPISVIVTVDVNGIISRLQEIAPGTVHTIEMGSYLYSSSSSRIAIVSVTSIGVPEGVYTVIEGKKPDFSKVVSLNKV